MKLIVLLLLATGVWAAEPAVMLSNFAPQDTDLQADPQSPFWRQARSLIAANDNMGKETPGHRTEIRSRWTKDNLYLLFICPYEQLYLHPDPSTEKETNTLWDWDVAEAFLGANFSDIKRYREYQVSPQGEWVDLDIDRERPLPEGGWLWNSGYRVVAKRDDAKKVWYGAMRIPFNSFDTRPAEAGREFRANFYRLQGPPPDRKRIAWRPTNNPSYHVPEAFGTLKLVK